MEVRMRSFPGLIAAACVMFACADQQPAPTEPLSIPVFSHASPNSPQASGGNFGTPLSAAEEVPPNPSRARGNAIFQLSADGTSLDYRLIVANIENVTQAHIHQGAFGVNGPVVVWLYPSTSPPAGPPAGGRIQGVIAMGTITADLFVGPLAGEPMSALIELLEAGNAYVNVHTQDPSLPAGVPGNLPPGEIRGQIEQRGH
jgi:hypothetical protein